ncbi:MAG: GNAT family N-acetyltransferase [Candidatus Heimdallarchaeota archaeon]
MPIVMRDFVWSEDFDLVHSFLLKLYNLTSKLHNWVPTRFENRKVGACGIPYEDEEDNEVKIWQDGKKIIAVTILEESDLYLNTHPDYKFAELDMIQWAEEERRNLKDKTVEDDVLNIPTLESDVKRIKLLEKLGFINTGFVCYSRIRPNDLEIPDHELPEGYEIKQLDMEIDFHKYLEVISSVFKHCKNMTEESARFFTKASFYNPDLDLVIVAPDDTFAAFCTIRLESERIIAEFEPVGTHPNHRKLGLAKAVMLEGLKRLENYDPTVIIFTPAQDYFPEPKNYFLVNFRRNI